MVEIARADKKVKRRKEYHGLSRDLTDEERLLLKGLGHRGPADQELRRILLAILTTRYENDQPLNSEDMELLRYYIKYPEERTRALKFVPVRTQSEVVSGALLEHFLLRNGGRFKSATYYPGTRRHARVS